MSSLLHSRELQDPDQLVSETRHQDSENTNTTPRHTLVHYIIQLPRLNTLMTCSLINVSSPLYLRLSVILLTNRSDWGM